MPRKYQINIEGEERLVDVVELGEKDYRITLGGETYQAHITEISRPGHDTGPASVVIAPAVALTAPRPAAAQPERPTAAPGDLELRAPLTGTIVDVRAVAGAAVKRGALLCLLEAMKMETEILATRDAVVAEVAVKTGATVQQGDVLFVLRA